MLEQVRSFNRVVTQSVGALHDHYLSRSLPLKRALEIPDSRARDRISTAD